MSVKGEVKSMRSDVQNVSTRLSDARLGASAVVAQTGDLRKRLSSADKRAKVAALFVKRFMLSRAEEAVLDSGEISEEFLATLAKLERIHLESRNLLRSRHQRAGLEVTIIVSIPFTATEWRGGRRLKDKLSVDRSIDRPRTYNVDSHFFSLRRYCFGLLFSVVLCCLLSSIGFFFFGFAVRWWTRWWRWPLQDGKMRTIRCTALCNRVVVPSMWNLRRTNGNRTCSVNRSELYCRRDQRCFGTVLMKSVLHGERFLLNGSYTHSLEGVQAAFRDQLK